MKTKEELIHNEWIKLLGNEAYESIKQMIDDDGYIDYVQGHLILKDYESFGKTALVDWNNKIEEIDNVISPVCMRPHSIKFIENNNGWTKINHRSEMPDYDCMIRVCFEGKPDKAIYQWEHKSSLMHVIDGLYVSQVSYKYRFYNSNTSHYKIVELDKEPLY